MPSARLRKYRRLKNFLFHHPLLVEGNESATKKKLASMSASLANHEQDADNSFNAMMLPAHQVYHAVLNAAIELNLFEIIGKGGSKFMSSSEIVSKLPNPHAGMVHRLDRMLVLLASYSLLTCSLKVEQDGKIERLYGLSHVGEYLISDEDGTFCVRLFKLYCHPVFMKIWENFKQVILDEEEDLFKKVHGMSMFEYMEIDPTFQTTVRQVMADLSMIQMKHVLERYKGFEGISTLVDVAGGIGHCLKMIISKYPSIQGINFDLPRVIQHGVSHPGITHVGGDMLKSVIPQGEAIMIKAAIHHWGDEDCIQILKNCHRSLKKDGKVIIVDQIIPEIPNESDGHKCASMFNNLKFLATGGSKDRTGKEFEALCKAAGFSSYHIASRITSMALGVIEFYK